MNDLIDFDGLWERAILAERTAKFVEAAQEAKQERIKHKSLNRDEYREMADKENDNG